MRQKLTISIVSIILVFVVLEVLTRLFVGVDILPEIKRMRLDPVLGWRWTPNYESRPVYRDHPYHLQISEQGLRNEVVVLPKPAQQQRIIALGDSITAGFGVDLEDTFAKQLQQALGVEVINAGVDDYGLKQELLWLERDGLALEPDLVLLEVYLNDSRPFSTSPQWVALLNNALLNRSAFYTYYYQVVLQQRAQQSEGASDFRFRYRDPWEAGLWKTDEAALLEVLEGGSDDFGLAWQQSENEKLQQTIRQIATLTDEHNVELLVLFFPVSVQVETDVELAQLDQPQQWLTAFAAAENIAHLDLLPTLRAATTPDGLYIDQAHLTPQGHTIVAEAIQTVLQAK